MLNRRHIRIKVMQSVYALIQSGSADLAREEKFLNFSIIKIYDLYVLMYSLLLEIRNKAEEQQEIAKKKFLATSEDINPNRKFVDNHFLVTLQDNSSLHKYLKDYKLTNWKEDSEYVALLWKEIKESAIFSDYLNNKQSSKEEDLTFIENIYTEIIAPNDKLYDYFESLNMSWVDDLPFVNTAFLKHFKKINAKSVFNRERLFKDADDMEFASNLLKKVALHHDEFTEEIDKTTPNWDTERIAEIDMILLKMALTEFVYFSSIPTRVTINEYLEIAKDYSTAKSSFFINGVLDKFLKEYTSSGKIQKIGRGLL